MTIGLYVIPTSDMIFRKLDGEWDALKSHTPTNDHRKVWKYYSTEKGKPIDGNYIETHENRQCLTYCRSVAKVLYGVPDNVQLYGEDTQSIQKFDQKSYIAGYNKANYDRIELKVPKGLKEKWKSKAEESDMSLTEWILVCAEKEYDK